jgi:multiple sugar transport system permease protein
MRKNDHTDDLRSYARTQRETRALRTVVCILLGIMSLLPFLLLFVNATRESNAIQSGITLIPGSHLLDNLATLNEKSEGIGINFGGALVNSLIIAVPYTVLSVYFSSMAAYAIHVYRFRMRKFAWGFILAVMIVPNTVSAIGFYRFMLKLNLTDSFIPLILPAIATPAVVFFMRQYFKSTLSLEMVEAARIDGSGELHTFNTIVLPLAKPALATQAIFQFIASWNNLFIPTLLLSSDCKKTLPMFVRVLKGEQFRTDYGVVYLGLAGTILPLFIVYFLLSKYIVAGVALGGVKE